MSELPIAQMLRDADAAWRTYEETGDEQLGDLACHVRALAAEIASLRTERDKLIESCIHDLRPAGYKWGWTLGLLAGRAETREACVEAVRVAAGLPRDGS